MHPTLMAHATPIAIASQSEAGSPCGAIPVLTIVEIVYQLLGLFLQCAGQSAASVATQNYVPSTDSWEDGFIAENRHHTLRAQKRANRKNRSNANYEAAFLTDQQADCITEKAMRHALGQTAETVAVCCQAASSMDDSE